MKRVLVASAAVVAVAAIVACGAGGTGSSPVPGTPSSQPSSAPQQTVKAVVKVLIPRRHSLERERVATRRGPRWISGSTLSFTFLVTPQNGTALPLIVGNVDGTYCRTSDGDTVCTYGVVAVAGTTNTFVITAYSALNAGGSALSGGTFTAVIPAKGQTPPHLAFSLTGVAKSLFIGTLPLAGNPVGGQTEYLTIGSQTSVAVAGLDALGEEIIGPMENVASIAISQSPSTTLEISPTTATSSGTVVNLQYGGAPLYANAPTGPITLSATGSSATTGTMTIVPQGGIFMATASPFPFTASYTQGAGLSLSGTTMTYAFGNGSSNSGILGTFDTTTGVMSAPQQIGSLLPTGMAVDLNSDVWLIGSSGGSSTVACIPSGTGSAVTYSVPDGISASRIAAASAADGDPALWIAGGTDSSSGEAAYYALTAGTHCPSVSGVGYPLVGNTPYPAGIAPASVGGVWIGDSAGSLIQQLAVSGTAAPTAPAAIETPPGVMTTDNDGNAWGVYGAGSSPLNVGEIVAGSNLQSAHPSMTFKVYTTSDTTVSPSAIAAYTHGGSTQVAIVDTSLNGVRMMNPASSSTPPYYAIAFDQACSISGPAAFAPDGSLYQECTDWLDLTQPIIAHAILTSMWSVYPSLQVTANAFSQSSVSIAALGGTGSDTFTLSGADGTVITSAQLAFASGGTTCSNGNCIVDFTPQRSGSGSFSVTGPTSSGTLEVQILVTAQSAPLRRRHGTRS